jgi:hypothetical protein
LAIVAEENGVVPVAGRVDADAEVSRRLGRRLRSEGLLC